MWNDCDVHHASPKALLEGTTFLRVLEKSRDVVETDGYLDEGRSVDRWVPRDSLKSSDFLGMRLGRFCSTFSEGEWPGFYAASQHLSMNNTILWVLQSGTLKKRKTYLAYR